MSTERNCIENGGGRCIERLFAFIILVASIGLALEAAADGPLRGTVVSVDGYDVVIEIPANRSYLPKIGDMVELGIGDWKVTQVKGDRVRAAAYNATDDNPPKVGMEAIFDAGPSGTQAVSPPKPAEKGMRVVVHPPQKKGADGGGLDAEVPGDRVSTLRGTVSMLHGDTVTIALDTAGSGETVGINDEVELLYTIDGDAIKIGTWKVSKVKEDYTIEAKPIDVIAQPSIGYQAIFLPRSGKKNVSSASTDEAEKDQKLIVRDQACDKGDMRSCVNLGNMYYLGRGVEKNNSKAAEAFRKACDGGDAETAVSASACYSLGSLYKLGEGVKKDLLRGAELHQKACDGGHAKSCRNLGYMYQNGEGLEQNYGKAMQLYKIGCEKGSADACNDVGVLYQKGWGVDKSSHQSVKFFRKACNLGIAMGCSNLGYRYQIGDGVQKDLRQASELYRKACRGGFEKGCRKLNSLQQ